MADACSGWHNTEVVEGGLSPLEEGITLHVALVLAIHVHLESAWVSKFVDHDRVVNHKVDRVQRVDLFGVATERHKTIAHGRKINNRRNAGKVLHEHAGRTIGDFAGILAALVGPLGKRFDVVHGDGLAILKAEHVFQHNFQRGGQAGEVSEARSFGSRDRVIGDRLVPDGERFTSFGGVLANGNGHVRWLP